MQDQLEMSKPILLGCLLLASAALAADLAPGHFSRNVYPVLQKRNCQGCHTTGGLASASRLQFPPPSAAEAEIEQFGRRLVTLVDRSNPEKSPLLLKPTNRDKHTGGELIQPGGSEEKLLIEWIHYLASLPAPESISEAATSVKTAVRRLTHSQYNNTVRDLLGDRSRPADQFPPEDFVNGFKNQSAAQDISPLLADAYNKAAERLARNAFLGGRDENKLLPCKPRNATDERCAADFIEAFGLRAFRRPVTSAEKQRYASLLRKEARRTADFLQGARLVIEAMLQSPKFLFRLEQDQAYRGASRLSFFLWDTMPDQELLGSAASGELSTRAGLAKTVRRMVEDPRAREAFDEFLSQWLRFDLVLNSVKDRRLFRQFNEELAVAMTEETRRLINDMAWSDRDFMQIFTAGHSFLNADLASLYGLPAPATEFAKVAYPENFPRGGILGQAMFLALTSKPGETSPTVRGFFVREHFLCQTVPDPPPGTNSNLPPLLPSRPLTNRQRLDEHVANPSCAGCHRLMDPIGFGLEEFDAIGQHRRKETITFFPAREDRGEKVTSVTLDLDARGEVSGIANSAFTGPRQLGELLARSPQCQECIVKQLFRYAHGRHETAADEPLIRRGAEVFRNSRFRLKELMMFLAQDLASSSRSH
jgi:hypothetical protein